jgi:hypothetical protein
MVMPMAVPASTARDVAQEREESRRGAAMSNTTLTLTLGGDVPLDLFAQTMQRFDQLLEVLRREVSGDADIAWTVEELAAGSSVVTIQGEADQPEAVERVSRAFSVVGQALEQNQIIPYSRAVEQAARSIIQVINGQIPYIQFDSLGEVATITSGRPVGHAPDPIGAYGSIEGRIETLTSRRGLVCMLYDSLEDRAIRCHLKAEQMDLVRDAWRHRALVQGWIQRHPTSGRPRAINPVRSIEVLPEIEPGSYRRARGILPVGPDKPSPEVVIRRLRDA